MQSNNFALRVVIPARFGSSRLPGKPLIDLAGKPMIVRVFEAVRAALPSVDIVVAVDDVRIQSILQWQSIPVALTSADHGSGTDRVAEVARMHQWNENDIILNVQGDEPLIPNDLLSAFARFCLERKGLTMATLAVPLDDATQIHDPNIVKLTVDFKGRAIAFSRAAIPFNRDLPPRAWPLSDYLRHVGIYAYQNDVLQRLTTTPPCSLEISEKLEQLRAQWLGISIDVMRWHTSPPHGVDTPADAMRVAELFKESTS